MMADLRLVNCINIKHSNFENLQSINHEDNHMDEENVQDVSVLKICDFCGLNFIVGTAIAAMQRIPTQQNS